ncbi:hypothetical protein [Paraburkholderia sp. C35]|uniref:hypothetical protein n=1 Tax=Paraburkholderia sp. C35 TaxID=2126993 RepID=UPI000D691799|nr:hypothetical protein [Paraburkholderia sp. C35]
MTNKVIALTALDGSKWHIPAKVVEDSYNGYYKGRRVADDDDLADWAQNNMNWSDVKAHALQVQGADENNMEDSWANGEMEVIDAPPPEPTPPAVPAAPAVAQAFPITRKMPTNALDKLFKNAGLVRGVETSIVLAHDADPLEVIQAIAADALTQEKTKERRLVLEGIRLACERTIALQQPAQVKA